MKLENIHETVDDTFLQRRREQLFREKETEAKTAQLNALHQRIEKDRKETDQIYEENKETFQELFKFIDGPVLSGGFKTVLDLYDTLVEFSYAIHSQRPLLELGKMSDQDIRAIKKAIEDENLYQKAKHYQAFLLKLRAKHPAANFVHSIEERNMLTIAEYLPPMLKEAEKYFREHSVVARFK